MIIASQTKGKRKTITVIWYVENRKACYEDELKLMKLVMFLGGKYRDKITVSRGIVHDYLGLDMNFSSEGVMRLSMIKHLEKIFADFPEDIDRPSFSPTSEHPFRIRDAKEAERGENY